MSVRQAPCPSNIVQHNHIRPEDPNKRLQEGQYETSVPTVADRVVQASLKLVLEPIFEADFRPCSYGFRPRRRAQDAIAEIHYLASGSRAITGFRGRHHGMLRRNFAFGPPGEGAATCRGQTRSGLGEVVPQGRNSLEGSRLPRQRHRYSARWNPVTAAQQYRPIRSGRALRREVEGARPVLDTRQASARESRP